MQIVEHRENDTFIYHVQGRLDSKSSPELEKRIGDAIGAGTTAMVLDFENLDYISSAGLRVILKATKDLEKANGRIVLCALKDYVQEVFEISGFQDILAITLSVNDAIKRLGT